MRVLRKNGEMVEVNFEEQEGKKAFWHTSAHVLAQAVKRLYPETKCAIGPAIENGFYYDFQKWHNWMNICIWLKKQKQETTENWERNLDIRFVKHVWIRCHI